MCNIYFYIKIRGSKRIFKLIDNKYVGGVMVR